MPVIERLNAHDVDVTAIELPLTSLADDAGVLRASIAEASKIGPVTVVCHSYTGITASVGGHGAQHIVHIASRKEDAHETLKRWLAGDHTSNNTYR